eukprot:7623739-Pyramimonas_sp.AAC.1
MALSSFRATVAMRAACRTAARRANSSSCITAELHTGSLPIGFSVSGSGGSRPNTHCSGE